MQQRRRLVPPIASMFLGMLVAAGACSKKATPNTPSQPAAAVAAVPGPARADQPSAKQAPKPTPTAGPGPAAVDPSKLDEHARKVFDTIVDREPSACGKGHSLRHSAEHDGSCRASAYAVRYVARLAGAGASEGEIVEKVRQRFRVQRIPYIDVSQAPRRGAPSGPVTIVEFADYQCDHCRQAQGLMHTILADYPAEVTLYFKHFPLGGHAAALNAAWAASAAQIQDKFWPYNDKVWEIWDRITPALLEGIAKDIGLDFPRWIDDVGGEQARTHVQRDKSEGQGLEIHRTPAIFINGRQYQDELNIVSLKDWINEELGR